MAPQRGSVLVTVMALTVVMTLAAGTLLMTAGNALVGEGDSLQRQRCFYDAESALLLGTGWLRGNIPPTGSVGSKATTLLSGAVMDNGCVVGVEITDTAIDTVKTVTAQAQSGGITISMSWEAILDRSAILLPENRFRVATANWRQSSLP